MSTESFAWGFKQRRAARLVAQDRVGDRQIAHTCAIGIATLTRWKREPEFAARVAEIRAELEAREVDALLAERQRRVRLLDRRHEVLEAVIEERAAEDKMRAIPGGTSGLVARKYKMIGFGKQAQRVEEYEVDVATLRELREIEKQAAIELGQWTEKRELSGQGGGPITVIEVREQGRRDGDGDGDGDSDPTG